jgi:hypothetical protein
VDEKILQERGISELDNLLQRKRILAKTGDFKVLDEKDVSTCGSSIGSNFTTVLC